MEPITDQLPSDHDLNYKEDLEDAQIPTFSRFEKSLACHYAFTRALKSNRPICLSLKDVLEQFNPIVEVEHLKHIFPTLKEKKPAQPYDPILDLYFKKRSFIGWIKRLKLIYHVWKNDCYPQKKKS
jgi:hypothetical protein